MLRLERDARSIVTRLWQATNEYAPHPLPPSPTSYSPPTPSHSTKISLAAGKVAPGDLTPLYRLLGMQLLRLLKM